MIMSNEVILSGCIDTDYQYDHTAYDEKFYRTYISVKRDSGYIDKIPLMISESQLPTTDTTNVTVYGQYRSHNNEQKQLILYVFVTTIEYDYYQDNNYISITGYICKQPVLRTTPNGRVIADVILAVPRPYGKTDYIPMIAWNRYANKICSMEVGSEISMYGRIQSREYVKQNQTQTQTAYEVSATRVE